MLVVIEFASLYSLILKTIGVYVQLGDSKRFFIVYP